MVHPRRSRNHTPVNGQTPCARCPLRKQPIFRPFTDTELQFVEWFKSGELTVDPGASVLLEGHNSPHLFTLLSGWAFRHKSLPDGRRQILSFALPGDFLGLQGPILKEMQHSVEALTTVTLCVFPRERLWSLYQKHPELSHDLVWLAMRGERMADDHLLAIGRRSATERISYLLLHLYTRCKALQLTDGKRLKLPLSQRHIADALGLSLVHTNKTLKRLEQRQLLRWKGDTIEIADETELRRQAHFEDDDDQKRPLI